MGVRPIWRYLFYSLPGNNYLGELPLENVAFETWLSGSGVGNFSAQLRLGDRRIRSLPWRAAVNVPDVVCCSECDGEIVAGHVIYDTIYHLSTQTLDLAGLELWSYYTRRFLTRDHAFVATDQLSIVRAVMEDAAGDTGGSIGLSLDIGSSGRLRDRTYWYGDAKPVAETIDQLSKVLDGFDYRLVVSGSNGAIPARTFTVGYPRLGRPIGVSNLRFSYPGAITDFDWPRQGSTAINRAIAIGDAQVRQQVTDNGRIASGQALRESRNTYPTAFETATLLAHATTELVAHEEPGTVPSIVLRRELIPPIGYLQLGDDALIEIEEPSYFPGPWDSPDGLDHRISKTFRVIGLKVQPDQDRVELVFLSTDVTVTDDTTPEVVIPAVIPIITTSPSLLGTIATTAAAAAAGLGGTGTSVVGGQQIVARQIHNLVVGADTGYKLLAAIQFEVPADCTPAVTMIAFGSAIGDGHERTIRLSIGAWGTETSESRVAAAAQVLELVTWKAAFGLSLPVAALPTGTYGAWLELLAGDGTAEFKDFEVQLWSS